MERGRRRSKSLINVRAKPLIQYTVGGRWLGKNENLPIGMRSVFAFCREVVQLMQMSVPEKRNENG